MTAKYLCTDLLSASAFNQIRSFEAQVHGVDSDDLRTLGQIFVTTNMHHDWAAGILTVTRTIHDDSVMMHSIDKC